MRDLIHRSLLLIPLVVLPWTACATSNVTIRRMTPEALMERGLEAYRHGDWSEAVPLFERLTIEFPTFPRMEEARFYLADSYFGREEYITAAAEFARVANDYPGSGLADDARFKVCESYRRLSPVVQRDQEYTRSAIDHCRALVTYYPTSELADEARAIIQEMETKLARKLYIAGDFYFKRGAYDSAVIYFEDVVDQYPATPVAPEALLRLVETYTEIGYRDEAEEARERLLQDYPDSPQAEQVEQASVVNGQ